MRTLAPQTGLVGLRKEMDRLFDRLWEPSSIDLPLLGEWVPPMDLIEGASSITVKMEVPGIDPQDIQLTIQDQTLTVRGEKKEEREEKGEQKYRMERTYGMFARAIHLPTSVDAKKVNATFKNGLPTVSLTKTAGADGTRIPIRAE